MSYITYIQRTHCLSWRLCMLVLYVSKKMKTGLSEIRLPWYSYELWIENGFVWRCRMNFICHIYGLVFVVFRACRQRACVHSCLWSKLFASSYPKVVRGYLSVLCLSSTLFSPHRGAYGAAVCPSWMPNPPGWHLLGLSSRLYMFHS